MESAYDSMRDSYPGIEDLREIVKHGCQSGVAHQHLYYSQTVSFFDNYEDEIIEYIADTLGDESNEQIWIDNPCNIVGYKNATVWVYVELVASQLIDEYESTTNEELSDSDDNVYLICNELANTEWGKNHLEIVTG